MVICSSLDFQPRFFFAQKANLATDNADLQIQISLLHFFDP